MENSRISTGQILLIVLLVLVLTGTISLGAIVKSFFYIVAGFIALALISSWLLRRRLRKMAQQGQQQRSTCREGEVTVEQNGEQGKKVNDSVGEYVEFEEVDE